MEKIKNKAITIIVTLVLIAGAFLCGWFISAKTPEAFLKVQTAQKYRGCFGSPISGVAFLKPMYLKKYPDKSLKEAY